MTADKRTDGRTDGRAEHEACQLTPTWRVMVGDVREQLALLPDASVQCVVTSPPYWGLRDYNLPPSIWGGEESCDHQWGAPVRTAWANSVSGPNGRQKNTEVYRCDVKETGPFCLACGAWRGCLGLEPSPYLFVEHLVSVFGAVRRVLRPDGVCWLNLGDSYAAAPVGTFNGGGFKDASAISGGRDLSGVAQSGRMNKLAASGLKPKDMVGIPWRVAFALQADGWYLRADVIWSKPNPMPESIKDRPTKSHEYLFLLTKSERYFYDCDAIKEPYSESTLREIRDGYTGQATKDYSGTGAQNPSDTKRRIIENARKKNEQSGDKRKVGFNDRWDRSERQNRLRSNAVGSDDYDMRTGSGRNARSVWTIPTQPYPDAHFATFPEALPERCIRAGSRLGDMVLDPFCGSGTTGQVAIQLGRSFTGVELNPTYAELARKRIGGAAPLFAEAIS